jgi:hypothetical protein
MDALERAARHAGIDRADQERAHCLLVQAIRTPAIVHRQPLHRLRVSLPRPGRKSGQLHVADHPLAQWCHDAPPLGGKRRALAARPTEGIPTHAQRREPEHAATTSAKPFSPTRSVAGGVVVQVRGGGGPKCSAGLRRGGATGQCELRTRFAGESLAKYRGAPPVYGSAQEGPAISVT